MSTAVKRTFLAALPLAGLLMLPGMAAAHGDDHQDRHGRYRDHSSGRHEDYHDWRKDLHREYHQYPSSKRSHRRFHRWLDRDHDDFHDDWSYYDRHDRGRHRGWYQGKHRGWYGNQRWYGNRDYRDGRWYYPYR